YGFSRSSSELVTSPSDVISTPRTMLANATPNSSGGSRPPSTMPRSHQARPAAVATLPRYSSATPLMLSVPSPRNRARKDPLHRLAYQLGKAANMSPPAVSSQTSLPSQTGPMVPSSARRSASTAAAGSAGPEPAGPEPADAGLADTGPADTGPADPAAWCR